MIADGKTECSGVAVADSLVLIAACMRVGKEGCHRGEYANGCKRILCVQWAAGWR